MHKKPLKKRLFHALTLSLIVILMGGGVALLFQWNQGTTPGHASSDNVVGPPSVPGSYVDTIFRRLGSPMVGTGQAVEDAARKQNIDDAFALGVWWTETNDGAAGVGSADLNPGSVRGSVGYPSAFDGYTIYPSFTDAINYWFYMLKKVYIDRGLTTVSSIAHPYVGTSTSNLWAGKVIALMNKYRGEAPTPTPTLPSGARHSENSAQIKTARDPKTLGLLPTPGPQKQNVTTTTVTAKTGLSGGVKLLLVIFDLILALVLALWAWNINRRYTSDAKLSTLLHESGQQPASLFRTFTESLRTTEELAPGIVGAEFLAATNPMVPTYTSSEALLSLGAFMSTQAQYQTPLPPTTGYLPPTEQPQSTRLPGLGLPGRPTETNQPEATANPFHRTQLRSMQFNNGWPTQTDNSFPQAEPTIGAGELPQPIGVGAGSGRGLLSRYRDNQTQDGQG